jgi:putative transposase
MVSIRALGKWVYLYRAVDSQGDTLDFLLSERRDEDAATAFFKQAINNNGFPDKVVMDKSGANYAGLANINLLLILAGFATLINCASNTFAKFTIGLTPRKKVRSW